MWTCPLGFDNLGHDFTSFQYLESHSWNQVILQLPLDFCFLRVKLWGCLFHPSILITVVWVPDPSAHVPGPRWPHAETLPDRLFLTLLTVPSLNLSFPLASRPLLFSPTFSFDYSFLIFFPPPVKWKSLSRVQLFATPWDYIVHGILQARILECVAFPFSRGSSQPRDQTQVFRIADGLFTTTRTAPHLTVP